MPRIDVRSALRSGVIYLLLWWVIAEGDPRAFAIGVLAVLVALAWVPAAAHGTPPLRWARLPRFVWFFLTQSVRGGFAVAARALRPRMGLHAGFVDTRLRVQGDAPRALVAMLISLFPGTLAARLEQDALRLHVLDTAQPIDAELGRVEEQVAALFGQRLSAGHTP